MLARCRRLCSRLWIPPPGPAGSFDRVNYLTDQSLHFDGWDADIAFGRFNRLERVMSQPEGPDGRILIAELGKGHYLTDRRLSLPSHVPGGRRKEGAALAVSAG